MREKQNKKKTTCSLNDNVIKGEDVDNEVAYLFWTTRIWV